MQEGNTLSAKWDRSYNGRRQWILLWTGIEQYGRKQMTGEKTGWDTGDQHDRELWDEGRMMAVVSEGRMLNCRTEYKMRQKQTIGR